VFIHQIRASSWPGGVAGHSNLNNQSYQDSGIAGWEQLGELRIKHTRIASAGFRFDRGPKVVSIRRSCVLTGLDAGNCLYPATCCRHGKTRRNAGWQYRFYLTGIIAYQRFGGYFYNG